MNILLQVNGSEDNAVTKALTVITSVTGTMRDGSSIIDPVIEVNGVSPASYSGCNYCTISDFGRSYFVKNIEVKNNNCIVIHLHSDVLSSFSAEFLPLKAVIARQENKWNLYLNDGMFKTYQNSDVFTSTFPSGFSGQSYVLAVAGGLNNEHNS